MFGERRRRVIDDTTPIDFKNVEFLRRFLPNIQRKRYFLPDEQRWITLSVSAHGMKIIDKKGLARVVADMRADGQKI
jgi:large subunit ribosomal protein L28